MKCLEIDDWPIRRPTVILIYIKRFRRQLFWLDLLTDNEKMGAHESASWWVSLS